MSPHRLVVLLGSVMIAGCDPEPGTAPPPPSLALQPHNYRLDTLPGARGRALAVSPNGTAVGWSLSLGPGFLPAVWRNGSVTTLPTTPAGAYAATDISTDGSMITGLGDYTIHLWRDGVLEDLGLPAGTDFCSLSIFGQNWNPHVNNAGQVTANCYEASTGSEAAFIHSTPTGWVRIGPSGASTNALDLTESGVVVGAAYDPTTFTLTGFSWRDGVYTDLGALAPGAVNARGQLLLMGFPQRLWTKGSEEAIPGDIGVRSGYGWLSNDGTVLGRRGLWDGKATTVLPGMNGACAAAGFSGPKYVVGWCGVHPVMWVRQ